MSQGYMQLIKKFFSICMPGVVAATVLPIFIHSIGGHIFCNKTFSNEGRLVFLFTTIIGQFVYSLFSSSQLGMIYFPLLDGLFFLGSIKNTLSTINLMNRLSIHIILLMIENILIFLVCILVFIFKKANIIYKIPFSVQLSSGIFNGIFYFTSSVMETTQTCSSHTQAVASLSLLLLTTLSASIIFKRFPTPLVLIPCFAIIIATMNGLNNILPENLWIRSQFSPPVSHFDFYTMIKLKFTYSSLDWRLIFLLFKENFSTIISLLILTIISFSCTLLLIEKTTKTSLNMNREFLAFGLANICALGCPGSINYACTILFILLGDTKKISSLITSFAYIPIYFCFHIINNYLPNFLAHFIMQFIGLSFLMEYIPTLITLSYMDIIITLLLVGLHFINGGIILACCCAILITALYRNVITTIFTTQKCVVPSLKVMPKKYILIPPVLDSFNIRDIIDEIKEKSTEPLILDFTQCAFVDITGNMALKDCIDMLHVKYKKIGSSINLYKI